mgnify:CR=1 FL=1
MNDTQVENWRRVLLGMVGPYALIMPREQIIALRDRLQSKVAAEQSVQADEACACDQKYHGYTKHMDGSVTCNHCRKPRR